MVALASLWLPVLVSAVFVFIASMIVHMIPGWHQDDMRGVPNEDDVMATLRSANLQPGEYRFPFGRTTAEMTTPGFVEKMKMGPVGTMTIRPNGELNMGKLMGFWFLYTLIVGAIAAGVTCHFMGAGSPYRGVFHLSAVIVFCCYSMAHWQNWIWWGKSTRYTLTYTVDGVLFAIVTGATLGWLWPK